MNFEVIKIVILKIISMKKTIFSKILVLIFLLGGLSVNAQVIIKTNKTSNNKTVVKKNNKKVVKKHNKNRGNKHITTGASSTKVIKKKNRHRIVTHKPNRPRVIVKRPNYHRQGYVWVEGYWRWNVFSGRYFWQKAKWKKIRANHYWVPGYWEIAPGGFFWVEGYWQVDL